MYFFNQHLHHYWMKTVDINILGVLHVNLFHIVVLISILGKVASIGINELQSKQSDNTAYGTFACFVFGCLVAYWHSKYASFMCVLETWSIACNSLWHNDTIWWYRLGSAFVWLMACFLTAPSHYLSTCWPIISGFCGILMRAISHMPWWYHCYDDDDVLKVSMVHIVSYTGPYIN